MKMDMSYVTKKSQVGILALDVLLTEEINLPAQATKYPVEDGTEISDHITMGAETLRISGSISTAEGLEFGVGGGKYRLLDALETLRAMHKERQLVSVITGLTKYTNMALTSLRAVRANGDKSGWLEITAELTQINKVTLRTAEVSEKRASPKAAGRAGQTQRPAGRSQEPYGPSAPSSSALLRGTEAVEAGGGYSGVIRSMFGDRVGGLLGATPAPTP